MSGSVSLFSINGNPHTSAPEIPNFRHSNQDSPTVLLVSGACSALPWLYGGQDSIAAQLNAKGRDVVVKPLLGFSSTLEDIRKFKWDPVMEDLRNELSSLLTSGRQVQLVGYSLGTFGVIHLAADRKFRSSCLQSHYPMVLFNPPFVLNDWAAKCLDWIYRKTGCFNSRSSYPPEDSILLRAFLAVRYGFGDVKIAKEYLDRIMQLEALDYELEIEGPLIYDCWPTVALARYLLQIPATRRKLLEIGCPVRILCSQLDQLAMPVDSLEPLLNPAELSRSTLRKIPNAGHFWLMQSPESRRAAVNLICDAD